PASIAYIDRRMSIGFANRQFAALWARTSDELVGRPLEDVIGAPLFQELGPHLARAFSGATATFDYTCGRPGEASTTHNVLVPEVDADGGTTGIFVLSLDITAARRAEAAPPAPRQEGAGGPPRGGPGPGLH